MITSQKQIISQAAHDLRTQLGIVLLELGMVSDPRARNIENNITQMIGPVNRLVGVARLEEMDGSDVSTIDMHSVATEILKLLEGLIQDRNCNISLKAEGCAEFEGDIDSIRETVLNLIENAVKHSSPGARIQITCGPGGQIIVEDDGPGMPEEMCEFFSATSSGGSSRNAESGLGLTIIQRTAELHGGVIEIGRSSLGGACISMMIPGNR